MNDKCICGFYEKDNFKKEIAMLELENARYREVLEEILLIIGPTPAKCGCEGCEIEIGETIAIIRTALAHAIQ